MDAVPETFIDALGEISFRHGMIRIELVSLSGPEPRVAQRLITSLQSFTQMLQAQNGLFAQLEKAGIVRPTEPPPETERTPERGGVVEAVRRLTRLEAVPQPAAPAALVGDPTPRPEPGPPRSPNFSQG